MSINPSTMDQAALCPIGQTVDRFRQGATDCRSRAATLSVFQMLAGFLLAHNHVGVCGGAGKELDVVEMVGLPLGLRILDAVIDGAVNDTE